MKRILFSSPFILSVILCNGQNETGTFTDSRDGQVYKWVKIENQVWMAENLAYLPDVSPWSEGSSTDPYYYVIGYNGTNVDEAKSTSTYKDRLPSFRIKKGNDIITITQLGRKGNTVSYHSFGVLYNWPATMNGATSTTSNPSKVQGVCPTGWHLPSPMEYGELTRALPEYNNSDGIKYAKSLMAKGIIHFYKFNGHQPIELFDLDPEDFEYEGSSGDTIKVIEYFWNSNTDREIYNSSGFSALPGGSRQKRKPIYINLFEFAYFWTCTNPELDQTKAFAEELYMGNSYSKTVPVKTECGLSVRCVKD